MLHIYSDYCAVAVKLIPNSRGGSHHMIRVIPLPGQGVAETLFVECSNKLRKVSNLGAVFILKAKITNKEGTVFLYSHFSWPHYRTTETIAISLIKRKKIGFYASAHWQCFLKETLPTLKSKSRS